VVVRVPVPKSTSSATAEFPAGVQGQTGEYKPADKVWQWTIKKFPGGQEFTARLRIILAAGAPPTAKKEIGPVSMNFELPMHSASGLQIRFLRIVEGPRGKAAAPFRWVRYLTISDSYVARI
jgi:AP-4 complex subunit mu-1